MGMETQPKEKQPGKRGRPLKKDGERQAELVQRRARVAELRRQSIGWESIAQQLTLSGEFGKIDRGIVFRDWQHYLKTLDPPADREERRADIREQLEQAVERARLDEQSARSAGDLALADRCALRALRVLGELRKLDGIDAPVESVVTVRGVEVAPLDRLAGILGE